MDNFLTNSSNREHIKLGYQKASHFFDLIRDEIKESNNIYGKEDANNLKSYYKISYVGAAYYKYVRHFYPERIKYLIKNIKKDIKVLDAGCGTGSESILCGILGGKVTGIDVSKNRTFTARKRVKRYENKLNMRIDINFYLENLLKHSNKYDLICVNEVISHVHPVYDFIDICYKNLKINGILIIADQNLLNPHTYFYSKKIQKDIGYVYRILKDPITGGNIITAEERFFRIPTIKNLLKKKFKNIKVIPIGFFPFFIFKILPKLCIKFEALVLRKLTLIRLFSASYVIICTKNK